MTSEAGNEDEFANIENEIKSLRQKKAMLLQEKATKDKLRREKLQSELQELKQSVKTLEQSSDEVNDGENQFPVEAWAHLEPLLYIAPPVLLYLVACYNAFADCDPRQGLHSCDKVLTHLDWVYVFISMYMYTLSCFVEVRMNGKLRTPYCTLIFISAVVTSVPSAARDTARGYFAASELSVWYQIANSHAKITVVVAAVFVLVCFCHSVVNIGADFLKCLGYVVMYGLLVGVICELYWNHDTTGLVMRNIAILVLYHISCFCIEVRIQLGFSFMLRACAVYALVCVYPYSTALVSKQNQKISNAGILELNHDQSTVELLMCLEFIQPIFSIIPMIAFDHFNNHGKSKVPLKYIFAYGVAVMFVWFFVPRAPKECFSRFIWFLASYCLESYFVKSSGIGHNFLKLIVAFIFNLILFSAEHVDFRPNWILIGIIQTFSVLIFDFLGIEILRSIINILVLFFT